jgi:hypothetical protein
LYGLGVVFFGPPALVHTKGEFAARAQIGEDYISAKRKEQLAEFVPVACFT